MRTLILIGLTVFTISAAGQDTVRPYYGGSEKLQEYPRDTTNDPGIKHAWLPNGQQIITDGDGYREYEMWGQIRRYYYRAGDANGPVFFWDTTKTILQEMGHCLNGELHGTWYEFYDNGQIYSIAVYDKGDIISDYQTFHENGKIQSITQYQNGKVNGTYIEYHPTGEIKIKGQFKSEVECVPKMDSADIELHRDIELKPKSIKVGRWTEYYSSGQVKAEMEYSEYCEFTKETEQLSEKSWINNIITHDCPTGKWKYYDENGKLTEKITYKNCKKE